MCTIGEVELLIIWVVILQVNRKTTIENNYFIVGPCNNWQNVEIAPIVYEAQQVPMNPARPFTGGNSDFRSYCKGNYYDYDKDGALNGIEITEVGGQYCSALIS